MSRKNAIRIGAATVGLIGAVAAGHWKNFAAPIQMALYTAMTVGLVLVGFWSDRKRPRFPIAICLMLAAHGAVLFAIRGIFPFRTILAIGPLAIMEGIALAILLLNILEYGNSSDI
jgi:hypothetical protein